MSKLIILLSLLLTGCDYSGPQLNIINIINDDLYEKCINNITYLVSNKGGLVIEVDKNNKPIQCYFKLNGN